MVRKMNKTLCFDGEVYDFLSKQQNQSEYVSGLIRAQMDGFPNIGELVIEKKKYRCPTCHMHFLSDEKKPMCRYCHNIELIPKEDPPAPPQEKP